MQYVDFDEVVAEAILTIGASGDDEIAKNFARTFIWRALQKLSVTDNTIQVVQIYAKNLLIKKPSNMKKLEEIALFDANGYFIPHVFHAGNSRIYPNTESYSYNVTQNEGTSSEETVTYFLPVDLSESDTSFVIGTNGTNVAYGLVRYYPYPLDDKNRPMVREDEVEACSAFVRYKWSQRKNENQSEIKENLNEWLRLADYCRAEKKSSDFSNEIRKQIASTLNRMIPNFNRSRF
jgi:hypothetical protein